MDIVVDNISKSFRHQRALNNVSFEVKKGEILGFLGPNGAGKTTIMRIISGFLCPTKGEVRIGPYSVYKNPNKLKECIGYLPEHNPLYGDMDIIDFLKFIANLHNIPSYKVNARVLDMLSICGLEHEKHKKIKELSKGYKQRVGLAQALIHDPKVIILDEPTTGLDPNQIYDIREVIKQTGKEKTIILSSHILAEIEAICDRVLILNKGEVVADGTSADIRRSSTHKTIRVKVEGGEQGDIYEKFAQIECIEYVNVIEPYYFELQALQFENIEKEIFEICKSEDWYMKELRPIENRLEDFFRQVTKS